MITVTANELKRKGISVVREAVATYGEVAISVHGKDQFIVMNTETYDQLREYELEIALTEARADIEAGRSATGSVDEHLARITQ